MDHSKLFVNESIFRAIIESTEDLIACRNKNHELVYFNAAFGKITKKLFDVDAFEGMNTLEYHTAEQHGKWKKILDKVLQGETFQDEFEWHFQNEEVRIYSLSLHPVSINGVIAGTVEYSRDITVYKHIEEQYRISLQKYQTLFDSFPIGITISDNTGRIVEANRESERLLGISVYQHRERTIDGKEWSIIRADGSFMPPEEYASVRALKENRKIENVEMGIVKGTDKVTWISVSAAPIPLTDFSLAIAYHDITEIKQAREELKRQMEELNRFNTLMVGRELKMIKLKKEINELRQKLGIEAKYSVGKHADGEGR